MNSRLTKYEIYAYLLALLLGLILRFASLGSLPLSDPEAALALQAQALASGESAVIGPQSGYVLFSSALFFLLGDTNALARFWPALFGSALVLAPLLFRQPLGRLPAVLLAFGLALDPGLTALSRQAGGTTWAIASLVFAAGFLFNRAFIPAGICIGLALLGGPAVWFGLVAALLAWGVAWLLSSASQRQEGRGLGVLEIPWRTVLLWAAGVFLVAGSLFFSEPGGISAAANSIPAYLRGWWTPSGAAITPLLMAVAAYAPLALVFGIVQGVRGLIRQNPVDRWLILFWIACLAMAVLLPGRSYPYLVWSMLPLWALASRCLADLRGVSGQDRAWVAGMAVLYLVLLAFAWLSVLGLNHTVNPEDTQVRLISFASALLLLVLTGVLLAWGWNLRVAILGAGWGIAAALLVVLVRSTVGAAGLGVSPENQLWRLGTPVVQADLLRDTAEDLSDWQTGERNSLDITVAGIDSPALQWLLNDFRQVRFENVLASQATPEVVMTAGEATPVLTTQYRGQDFVWTRQPVWSDFTADTWWDWLAYRQAPVENRTIILWARADVFPGDFLSASE